MNKKLPDYYKILGVERNADTREIERAFKQMAMKCQPDRFSDPQEKIQKTREFQQLNDAYMLLSRYVKRKDYDIALEQQEKQERAARAEEERMAREAQERREREEQERRKRKEAERRERENQGFPFRFEFNGFWFEIIKCKYGYESASEAEIARQNAFTPPEEVERINRVLKPFEKGGSFFDATSPICGASITVHFTNKDDFSGEFLFTKHGVYNYSWKGTFQLRGHRGSVATYFMEKDFKSVVASAYNTAMKWADEIIQNGQAAPTEPEDDDLEEEEPESYQEEESELYQEESPAANSYDSEGDIENEEMDSQEDPMIVNMSILYYIVPILALSVFGFCGGLTMIGAILLLIAITVGGILFLICNMDAIFFKKTKPKPTPAKPKPATAKPQTDKQAPVNGDPDSEGWQVWALLGLVILFVFVIFIQLY